MRWFKHLTNASSDYKILCLEDEYGHLGYSFYWKLIEFMAGQWSGFGEPEVETTFKYLRQLMRTQEPKIKAVLESMRNFDLLEYTVDGNKVVIKIEALKNIRDNSSTKKVDNRGLTRELKSYIVQRDNNQCSYCSETLYGKSLNFDHFIPVSLGGKSIASNVVLSCDTCNKIKHMKHPDEIEIGPYSFRNKIAEVRTKLSLEEDKNKIKKENKNNINIDQNKFDRKLDLKFDFEKIYELYPKKIGKARGLKTCKTQIKNQDDYLSLIHAVNAYTAHCSKNINDPKYIMHFSTFMASWRDWLDQATGSVSQEFVREDPYDLTAWAKKEGEAS